MLLVFAFPYKTESYGQAAKKLVIVPFALHAEGDLTFLKNGIAEILNANLALNNQGLRQVVALERETVEQMLQNKTFQTPLSLSDALKLGAALQAQYVVSGTQTILGDTVSTNATCIDVEQKKAIVTYNHVGQKKGDILSHMHQFTHQVNAVLSGKEPEGETIPGPEQLSRKKGKPQKALDTAKIWTSQKVPDRIISVVVGDLDGDGANETVFSSENKLYIYRYVDGKLVKIKEMDGEDYNRIISIDTADINQNGKSEVFVNAIRIRTGRTVSYVIEFKHNDYTPLVKELNWHFRVITNEQEGPRLIGQMGETGKNLFRPGIYRLAWKNGGYESVQPLNVPGEIPIYGFNIGRVFNNGADQTIALSPQEKVVIYNNSGEPEWASTETYGGSEIYLEYPSELDRDEKDHFYLKQRVYLDDLDQDGQTDIVLVKNEELSGRLFARFRSYNKGHLECLNWNKLGLQKKWQTQEISGYISDFGIYDLDNDGQKELVYSVVSKGSFFFSKKNSYLVAHNLQ